MLRTYVELQRRINALRNRAVADDGTTVPEYMLVLGFISIAIVVLFQVADVGGAVNTMTTELANMIDG